MQKDHYDLCNSIKHSMSLRSGKICRPFLKKQYELIMYHIALEMDWLQSYAIIKKYSKASNKLVKKIGSN
jgi:hypothetical protein